MSDYLAKKLIAYMRSPDKMPIKKEEERKGEKEEFDDILLLYKYHQENRVLYDALHACMRFTSKMTVQDERDELERIILECLVDISGAKDE